MGEGGMRISGLVWGILPVVLIVFANAVPLPSETIIHLAEVDETSPMSDMVKFINAKVHKEERLAEKTVTEQTGQRSLEHKEDKAIDKALALRDHQNGETESNAVENDDVGEAVSAFYKMETKAAARAKVVKEM